MLFGNRAFRGDVVRSTVGGIRPYFSRRRLRCVVFFALALLPALEARSQVKVFLDFNGTWISNLDSATAPKGFTFSSTERGTIESTVVSTFETVFSNFDIDFVTAAPTSGAFHRVNFGASTGGSGFGSAPLDFRNQNANQTQSVFAANFGSFIETTDSVATQIAELSTSLAGTGAHELGHSLGLRHLAAYGDPLVREAIDQFGNTQGIQNGHIMATGSTGLNEAQRESPRTFSQWSNVLLEAADGLTASPLTRQVELGDAGDVAGSAQALSMTALPISGLSAGLTWGRLSNESDVDFFSFEANAGSLLTAELWSDDLFTTFNQFDSLLTLYDTDGTTVLFSNDDTEYSGNTLYNSTFRENDSFLAVVELSNTGTYYLSVASVGNRGGPPGGDYNLIFAVPEPSSWVLIVLGGVGFAATGRRRRGGWRA